MNPYDKANSKIWWKEAVSGKSPNSPEELYLKKFSIGQRDRISTGGSCFAQHIARYMRGNGYQIVDMEPMPFGMSKETGAKHGYGVYSCRYGNIYHVRQLNELLNHAIDGVALETMVWSKGGRFFDALRPTVEPFGFETAIDVLESRKRHLDCVLKMFKKSSVFIFTLGLTEAWVDKSEGLVVPVFPGVYGEELDRFEFLNFNVKSVYEDFLQFRELALSINPDLRFILTVSPVPLVATATGQHVLPATIYSKSVLRAVAGMAYESFPDVDYFPSYEIISSHWSRGQFYEDNMRDVTREGVSTVMDVFFDQHLPLQTDGDATSVAREDANCDDVLLEVFQK